MASNVSQKEAAPIKLAAAEQYSFVVVVKSKLGKLKKNHDEA